MADRARRVAGLHGTPDWAGVELAGNLDPEVTATRVEGGVTAATWPLDEVQRCGRIHERWRVALPTLFTQRDTLSPRPESTLPILSIHWTSKTAGAQTKISRRSLRNFSPADCGGMGVEQLEIPGNHWYTGS